MAMGKNRDEQEMLFVTRQSLRTSGGHPFYEALNRALRAKGFDGYVEGLCEPFYADNGRPGLPPGVYFRCLLIGYFEGIDSERGIAWRAADSMSLRHFLGLPLDKNPPDHSTLSRTRRLLDLETHHQVFSWVLSRLAEAGLLQGKTVGVDGTTLEANAALRSIVRRDDGQEYEDYLRELAQQAGVEEPSREDLARVDRKRPKKGSNKEWVSPSDPDAEIMKMKDGRTHLAHKQEHAVDMDTGAVVAVTIKGGAAADTKTVEDTLEAASQNLEEAKEKTDETTAKRMCERIEAAVLDKGYHSNEVLLRMDECCVRAYISEPRRGRRRWKGKLDEKRVVYANRRRVRGSRGKEFLRRRGELVERSFAHTLETGGMRRTHLRGHENILKRMLVHVAGFNLGLLMRALVGVGKPRVLQGRPDLVQALVAALLVLWEALMECWDRLRAASGLDRADPSSDSGNLTGHPCLPSLIHGAPFTTAC